MKMSNSLPSVAVLAIAAGCGGLAVSSDGKPEAGMDAKDTGADTNADGLSSDTGGESTETGPSRCPSATGRTPPMARS
jgi:hypothetical protein